ncbi:MAG TPA: hypothetical protein VF590_20250 [Isosphaeraceae bacterium]
MDIDEAFRAKPAKGMRMKPLACMKLLARAAGFMAPAALTALLILLHQSRNPGDERAVAPVVFIMLFPSFFVMGRCIELEVKDGRLQAALCWAGSEVRRGLIRVRERLIGVRQVLIPWYEPPVTEIAVTMTPDLLAEVKPFLLKEGWSRDFLTGDPQRVVRRQLAAAEEESGLSVMILCLGPLVPLVYCLVIPLVWVVGSALKWEAQTINAIGGAVTLMVSVVLVVGGCLEKTHSERRLLRHGQILEGSLIRCSGGETYSIAGESEAVYYYEVKAEYHFTTPRGREVVGKETGSRCDLRDCPLPPPGNPVLILYLDDSHYRLL